MIGMINDPRMARQDIKYPLFARKVAAQASGTSGRRGYGEERWGHAGRIGVWQGLSRVAGFGGVERRKERKGREGEREREKMKTGEE
jgi:hypothetical protein